MTKVWTSSSSAPSKKPGDLASSTDGFEGVDDGPAHSAAVRTPARASERAKACEPRTSASSRRRSKCSEFEKRSKTSDGPVSKRPPQSFI
jgi:hypothetical protein